MSRAPLLKVECVGGLLDEFTDEMRASTSRRADRAMRRYYDAEALRVTLAGFEAEYGITSAEFHELTVRGDRVPGMPGFTRCVWASMYRDWLRLRP